MIREDIMRRSKEALRARDRETRSALSSILGRFTEKEKSPGFTEWSDEAELAVVKTYVKGLKKSIDMMAGTDVAAQYQKEVNLLVQYMPKTMSEGEIRSLIEPLAAKANGKLGPFMGMVMKQYKGQVDASVVKKIGQELGLS